MVNSLIPKHRPYADRHMHGSKMQTRGQMLDAGADKYLKKHPGAGGFGQSEDMQNYPDDDSVESPGLYKKGLRFLPSDNNPSGDDD